MKITSNPPAEVRPVDVRLDEGDMALAKLWSAEVLGTGIERAANYTGISRPDRYVVGYLGELALAAWLRAGRVLFQHRVQLCGASDAPEFRVWMDRRPAKLDVKTASGATHTRLMMPAAQALDADLYVAARIASLPERLVELHGWIGREALLAREVGDFGHGPTRFCPFGELSDMRDLLLALDGERAVIRKAEPPGLSLVATGTAP